MPPTHPNMFTYIPPPPLPAFYLPQEASKTRSESSKSSGGSKNDSRALIPSTKACLPINLPPPKLEANPAPQGDEDFEKMSYRYEHHSHARRHSHSHHTSHRRASTSNPQPPPAEKHYYTVPPLPPTFGAQPGTQTLAVYHICRICLRPRSEKYHLEHPVPPNGAPDPPGICRRCRVTDVRERTEYVQVVRQPESEKVRLGVQCLVDEDDILTKDQVREEVQTARRRDIKELLRSASSSESDGVERERVKEKEKEKVVYRYIEVEGDRSARSGKPTKPAEVSVENLTAMNLMNDQLSGKTSQKGPSNKDSMRAQPTANPPPQPPSSRSAKQSVKVYEVAKMDSTKASMSAHTSKTDAKSSSSARRDSMPVRPHTDSEIRKIAREEVEKYRQAERRMEAHPQAYAHGKIAYEDQRVPVSRRIEIERDEVEVKPWEVPAAKEAERESVRVTVQSDRRSRRDSVATKATVESTNRSDRAPSEDSRFWYRCLDEDDKSEKSRSQAPPKKTTKEPEDQKDARKTEDVWNVRVVERRPPSPARGPPAGVELREVVGIISEGDAKADKLPSPTRSRRSVHDRREVIEVYEEVELPPRRLEREPSVRSSSKREPPVSDRVKELQVEYERKERVNAPAPPPQMPNDSVQSSFRTDREYWEDGAVVQTASGLSSLRPGSYIVRQIEREDTRSEQTKSSRSDRASALPRRMEEEREPISMPSPRQYLEAVRSQGASDDDRSWYAEKVKTVNLRQGPSSEKSQRPADDDSDRTIHPKKLAQTKALPPQSPPPQPQRRRLEREADWDWEYRERIVQPADRPLGSKPFDEEPGRWYTESERIYSSSRPPPSKTESLLPPPPPAEPLRPIIGSRVSHHPSDAPSRASQLSRGRGPYTLAAEESARVRFASKVEISPTPPGSDEYLPEKHRGSDARRAHGSRGDERRQERRRGREEEAQEIFDEYERRGRNRERSRLRGGRGDNEQGHDYDRRAEYQQSSTASGHGERQYRGDQRRSPQNRRERRPSPAAETETATQLSRSKPLVRALSESPSRELLRQEFLARERGANLPGNRSVNRGANLPPKRIEEHSLKLTRNLQSARGGEMKRDSVGPYREERWTESMEALWGSGHGRTPVDAREREARVQREEEFVPRVR